MDWSTEVMMGDFVQLAEDGEFFPVQRVRWDGVDYIDVCANLETRFAPFDAIYAVVPNPEYRAMYGEEW